MSPVFGHGRLRLYLLKLLGENPRHGYEVIRLLQDRFLGVYAPSPGTIYPRLARLEAEGLITHEVVAGRKVYRLTDAGRAELDDRLDEIDDLEQEITASVRDIAREVKADVRETVRSLRDELTAAAREMREDRGSGEQRAEPSRARDPEPEKVREQVAGHEHDDSDSDSDSDHHRRHGPRPGAERDRRRERRTARDAWREATRKQHDEWRRQQRHWHDQARSWQEEWRSWGEEWRRAWEEAWSPWHGDPDAKVRAGLDHALREFVSDVRNMARECDLDDDALARARTALDETLHRLRREVFDRDSP
jgi:DNA-binding PadR family transcriptional regulator